MAKSLLPLFLFLLLAFFPSSAQDVPITYRDIEVRIVLREDSSAIVSYEFTLENRASVPVVPGYGYFNMSSGRIIDARAEVMEKRAEVIFEDKYARYSIWEVIKPGGSIKVKLNFTVSGFLSKGVLFDEFDATLGPFSYPIERGSLEVIPESGLHLVYLQKGELNSLEPGESVRVRGEVSRLPLPMLPFSWYPILWGTVILSLALALSLSMKER
ncbi:MAG: hypothetical protein NZ992_05200, partial [Candidatus Korarchaeum sp.]|nr:hypothetical protein [Candidatus Korarchaeum sp.]